MNNNVSKFTSSAGGVSMTEKFDYGKDNLASKYTYPSGKTATYSYDSILRRNRTVINTTTPIDHQYVDSHERTLILHSLVELKNALIRQGSAICSRKLFISEAAMTAWGI